MRTGLLISLLIFGSSLTAQPCTKVVNMHGQAVDLSCPDGPPGFFVGTLYESNTQGDWSGGQRNNCVWPADAYAYIDRIDSHGTCHVVIGTLKQNFGTNFHGVCLGTYYVTHNSSHKNIANIGWGPGEGFASNEEGDNCFWLPGSNSTICSPEKEGSCFAELTPKCHVHITQGGGDTIACKTAGTGH